MLVGLLFACQSRYGYLSKVRVGSASKQKVEKNKLDKTSSDKEKIHEEISSPEKQQEQEVTASEGAINMLLYLPKIQFDFGNKQHKRDSVVAEFRQEYKSLKQKFPKSEPIAKHSNLPLIAGIAFMLFSILLLPSLGYIAIIFAVFGLIIILVNLLGRHKVENKELIEKKKAYKRSDEGSEKMALKYRRILSLVLMFLTLLSLFAFTSTGLILVYMLFAGPALLASGIVGYQLDLDGKDSVIHIIAIIIGAAATILLVFLLVILAFYIGTVIYSLLFLALALLLFWVGRELAKIHSPKR